MQNKARLCSYTFKAVSMSVLEAKLHLTRAPRYADLLQQYYSERLAEFAMAVRKRSGNNSDSDSSDQVIRPCTHALLFLQEFARIVFCAA